MYFVCTMFVLPTKLVLPTESFINGFNVCNSNMREKERESEDVLIDNIKSFLSSADTIYENKDFTSATILYFKTLFAVLDLMILRKIGKIPEDHSERFRILENFYPKLYSLLDKYYPTYRDTYNKKINKEVCEELKKNVKKIIEEQKIFVGD